VADTPELRAAYNEALPKVTDFWTRLGADERLYAKYKAMDPATLTPEQARAHHNALQGFVLGGAELQGEAKARFAAIQERSAELAQKFSENTRGGQGRGARRPQAHPEDAGVPAGDAVRPQQRLA